MRKRRKNEGYRCYSQLFANYTHSNKAINGEATQSQSLYIQSSLNPQNTYPG